MTNLRQVKENVYMEGDRIIRDLKDIGWVVVKGVRVDSIVDGAIRTVSNIYRTLKVI